MGGSARGSRWGRALAVVVAAVLLGALGAAYLMRQGAPPGQGPSAPASPRALRGTAGDGQITIAWDLVSGAEGYNIYRASSPGVTKLGYGSLPDGARYADVVAPYTIAGLVNDRVYYFRVTAFNDGGESDISQEISVKPVGVPPVPALASPENVAALAGDGQIVVSWDPVSGAAAYHLYRASEPGVTKAGYAALPDGRRFANVASPYILSGLAVGRTYYLRMTAENGAGESDESAEVSAVPTGVPPATAPTAPTSIGAIAGDGQVVVSWESVTGAAAYHLYQASQSGVTRTGYATMPDGARLANVASPYIISALTPGKTYYVRVTAENAAGESAESAEASATPTGVPPPTVPTAPTNIVALAGETSIVVSWDPVPGAGAYHVFRASQPGVTKTGYGTMPDGARFANVASPYTMAGLVIGRTYYVRVTAENAAGESDESAEGSATPAGPLPGTDLFVTGLVEFDSGAPVPGASVIVRTEDGSATTTGTTGPDGSFNIGLRANLPARVLAEVRYESAGDPPVTGFRWSPELSSGGAVVLGRVSLPEPSTKQLIVAGTVAISADGSVVVEAFPANVAAIWARPYDPDATPDVFPGDLAERRDYPLNSVVFLWISALDASGSPVFDVDPPATVRMRIPSAQWVDAEDLQPGNGVIDTPIYSLDYGTAYWVREPNGRLTDAAGVVIPEAFESDIRSGVFSGDVYGEFQATHFSWWNIDKPPSDCGPDFGDAADPPYPSLLMSDGARHLDICRAWLGAWVDAEDDADVPDLDRYDDGILSPSPLKVRVSNWNWGTYLYLNALIDTNADGDWGDAGEWAVQNLPVSVPKGKGKAVEMDAAWDGDSYLRLTLTGSPVSSYIGKGEFAIGETEDYPFFRLRLNVYVTGNGTVTSDPPAISCRKDAGPCFGDFRQGTSVTLTADPDTGESFIDWRGDCSGSNATCIVLMDQNRYVVAAFTAPYHRLTVMVFGWNQTFPAGGNVTSAPPGIHCSGYRTDPSGGFGNCTAVFARGTIVTLTAIPDTGWVFLNWAGDCTGTAPTCTVTMDRDRSVIAYFLKL